MEVEAGKTRPVDESESPGMISYTAMISASPRLALVEQDTAV
jgi:hypothetical protein